MSNVIEMSNYLIAITEHNIELITLQNNRFSIMGRYLVKVKNKGTSAISEKVALLSLFPAGICLFKVSNGTPEQCVKSDVNNFVLVSLLLTLIIYYTLLYCFHCWLMASKYWLGCWLWQVTFLARWQSIFSFFTRIIQSRETSKFFPCGLFALNTSHRCFTLFYSG